jgi:hypothetical protein
MKLRHVVMGSLCVALVGSSVVFAGQDKKENQRKQKHGERSAAHFKASDTDGNGSISLSEFTVMHEKRVARMKKRQGDRWDAERAAKRPSAAAIYKTIDADGNDSVSKAEMQEAGKRMHARHGKRGKRGKGKGKASCGAASKATPEVAP